MNPNKYYWQGSKIRLRPVKENDWEARNKDSLNSEDLRLMNAGMVTPATEDIDKEWAAKHANFKSSPDMLMFTIESTKDEVVGSICLHSMDQENGVFSMGVRIYKPYRRLGYAKEAKLILLRYAFNELRYNKCNVSCLDINKEIIEMNKGMGFKHEGYRRKTVYTNGIYHDEELYGMTKDEYDDRYSIDE